MDNMTFYEDMLKRKRMLPQALGMQSPDGVLTQDVKPGNALPLSLSIRKQIAELEDQPDDMSAIQQYAEQRGDSGQSAMLNALAAQFAGEKFAPVQALYLKRAMAAQEPMRVGKGMITPDGQYIVDPGAKRESKIGRLSREAEIADRSETQQGLQAERFAEQRRTQQTSIDARREADAREERFRREMALLRGSQGGMQKPPADYRFKPDGSLEPIPGGRADTKLQGVLNNDTAALQSSESALNMLQRAANEVANHPGLPRTTGLMSVLPNIPGSKAADALAKLEQLRSQVGFAVLQAMRDASKTGGALGNVSNFEVQALQNNLAALQNAQSEEQIREELNKLVTWSEEAKGRLRNAYNMKHSAPGPSDSPAKPAGTLSAEEQAELDALRRKHGR